jgi:hypothetical protein
MRGLGRSILAVFTMGLSLFGCNQGSSPGTAGKGGDEGPDGAPYHAAFRVPGMT